MQLPGTQRHSSVPTEPQVAQSSRKCELQSVPRHTARCAAAAAATQHARRPAFGIGLAQLHTAAPDDADSGPTKLQSDSGTTKLQTDISMTKLQSDKGAAGPQVRSCTLDTWLADQVAFMAATGNTAAARHWEARLPAGARPRQADNAALQVGPAPPPSPCRHRLRSQPSNVQARGASLAALVRRAAFCGCKRRFVQGAVR